MLSKLLSVNMRFIATVLIIIKATVSESQNVKDTHPFNSPFSGTTRVSRYQKAKTSLDFTEATDSEWQWHQQGHMQVCISLQTDNHTSIPPLSFYRCGSHANKYQRKIKINLRTKVEICLSAYSNADAICYSATLRMELNERNSA